MELHLVRFELGASFTFWMHCSLPLFRFTQKKYAILLHLAWLNSKRFGFALFLRNYHEDRTAPLVCDSVYFLLDSGWVESTCFYSACYAVNCTWATSNNCDATITFLIAQQWTTSDATTIISCSAICTKAPVQITGLLGVWMRHSDLKISWWCINILKQTTFPLKRRTLTEPITLWEPVYKYIVPGFWPKLSSFRLPYQRHSSSDCTLELFKPSKDSASLLVCTQKNVLVGGCGYFVWVTS